MKIYALIQNNFVYNIIETDDSGWPDGIDITDLDAPPSIGWTYTEESGFAPPEPNNEPAPPDSAPAPARRIVTNLAFDLRFTVEERIAIELASIDNPSAPIGQRTQAAALRVAQERSKKALFTDLDDPITRQGVLYMEQAGLLAEGRALEILDTEVTPGEVPWNV